MNHKKNCFIGFLEVPAISIDCRSFHYFHCVHIHTVSITPKAISNFVKPIQNFNVLSIAINHLQNTFSLHFVVKIYFISNFLYTFELMATTNYLILFLCFVGFMTRWQIETPMLNGKNLEFLKMAPKSNLKHRTRQKHLFFKK